VSALFRRRSTRRSPVDSLLAGEPEPRPARQGPSLLFAFAVIGGVAVMTAGAVAGFFMASSRGEAEPAQAATQTEPAQAAAEAAPTIAADQPILTASLDPAFPPVRKVTTKSFPALKQGAVTRPIGQAPQAAPQPKPVEVASAADVDELEKQNPRWAVSDASASDATYEPVLPGTEDEADAAAPLEEEPTAEDDDPTDGTRTAAIAPDEAKPSRKAKRDEPTAEDDAAPAAGTRQVQVNRGVNLRSRPKSGSRVLTVVPGRAVVQLVGCKAWCEVIYKGRRGYVYKSYIGGSKRSASTKVKASNKAVAVADQPAPKSVYKLDQPKPAEEDARVKFTSPRLQ
jgi:hypothetical protein